MTLQLQSFVLARRTMRERHVVICNVVEEVNLLLLEQECRRDGMHRGIAPSLVEEPPIPIQGAEEIQIRLRAKPV